MNIQLIFNEADVKGLAPVIRNISGEFLSAAMFEAQEIGLKDILGSRLLRALKERETAHDWTPTYEDLKEKCLPYLVYKTIVALIPKVSYKIANAGAYQTTDEKMSGMTKENIDTLIESYQANADYFCHELQLFICENQKQYPELDACHCAAIQANLRSAASCGLWLGGYRGNSVPGEGCC